MRRLRTVAVLAVLAAAGSALATRGGDDDPAPAATTTPPVAVNPQLDTAEVRVVRAWADALRGGDVERASGFFALPSRASNGSGPLTLRSRAEVRAFNAGLPCGARVIASETAPDGFFIVTFVLTERPGPGTCGAAPDATARTAFRVKAGKITDWVRVEDLPRAQGQEA